MSTMEFGSRLKLNGHQSPCRYCQDRHTGCWGACALYFDFKAKIKQEKASREQTRQLESFVYAVHGSINR